MADIRNFVGFAQTETLVKEYDGLRMYSPVRAKIGIAVTTKRLIAYSNTKNFFDQQRSESFYQQVNIEEIKGIGIVQSSRYRPGILAGGIVVLLIGIVAAVIGLSGNTLLFFGGIAGVVLGIVLAITGALWKNPSSGSRSRETPGRIPLGNSKISSLLSLPAPTCSRWSRSSVR